MLLGYLPRTRTMRQKACQEWDDKAVVDSSSKKVKRKHATLKTRKSIGSGKCGGGLGGNSDSDNDFMPTKKAAAAKARNPIPAAPAPPPCPRPQANRSAPQTSSADPDDTPPRPP